MSLDDVWVHKQRFLVILDDILALEFFWALVELFVLESLFFSECLFAQVQSMFVFVYSKAQRLSVFQAQRLSVLEADLLVLVLFADLSKIAVLVVVEHLLAESI